MEIRAINKDVNVEYPRMEDANIIEIEKDVDMKVAKVDVDIVGGMTYQDEIELDRDYLSVRKVSAWVGILSIIVFFISILSIIIGKLRFKKTNGNEPYKLKKGILVLLILSIVFFVLDILFRIIFLL